MAGDQDCDASSEALTQQTRARRIDRFTDLEVWRRSHELFLVVIDDLESLPLSRVANILIDQSVRALGSVGANVAEGFNRSRAKYLSALDIAQGEANETENWLVKLRDAKFLPAETANAHVAEVIRMQKMPASLRRAIAARPDRPKPSPSPTPEI